MTGNSLDIFTFVSTGPGRLCLIAVSFFLISGVMYLRKVGLIKLRKCRKRPSQKADGFDEVLKGQIKSPNVSQSAQVFEKIPDLPRHPEVQGAVELPVSKPKKNSLHPVESKPKSHDTSINTEKSYLKVERMLDLGMSIDEIGKRVSIPCCEIELISYLRRNYRRSFEPSRKIRKKDMKTQKHATDEITLVKGAVYQGVVLERIAGLRIRVGLNGRSFWCKSHVEVQPGDAVMLKVDQLEPKIICKLIYRKDPHMGRVAFNI